MKKSMPKVNLIVTIVLILIAIGASIAATWGITYGVMQNSQPAAPADTQPETTESLYDDAVRDAMTIEEDEILPLVSLEKGAPYAVYDDEGRVLLFTYHRYPDSYPDGADVKLAWGEVWTFVGGELDDWYDEEEGSITDWDTRLRQLIGLTPDNGNTHVTAIWVDPDDVTRPANVQDIGDVTMTATLSADTDEAFGEWFDDNIIWSYFDSAYPWTRLGYTYDWAADAKDEYGLSEFLVASGSEVEVAYTVTSGELRTMLENDTWLPAA